MFLFTGPLNGFLLAKTSDRFVSFLGAILLVISHIAFAYSPRPIYMYLSYGVLYGKAYMCISYGSI